MRTPLIQIALLMVVTFGMGCHDDLVPLKPAYFADLNYVTVDAHFCTSAPNPATQKIKYLFILDHSQSNQPGFPNPLTPQDVSSTDPQGVRRYGPLVSFITSLTADPNNLTSWGLIDFNDTAYQLAAGAGFNTNASSFVTQLQTDWIGNGTAAAPAPKDKGFTNYQSALQLADQIILADAKVEAATQVKPPVTVSYHVVFVSDGVPTVAAGSSTYTQTFAGDLAPLIAQLIAIKSDPTLGPVISGIELDTAYYFQSTEVVAAETLLQQMATAGDGLYFQFGAGANIAYQNFAPPNRNVAYTLDDVWVDNQNVVWWDTGQIMHDSGGSGLPDQIRVPLGGIPGTADSDGNGVSDLVEFRTKNTVCKDPACNPAGRDPYAVCSGLNPTLNPDGTIHYPSTSKSGFNDCEAFVLGASLVDFSTNNSFIPDFLAFKNTLPFLVGSKPGLLDPFNDGLTNYQKLKLGLPIQVSKNKVSDFQTRNTTLTHDTSPVANIDCYHVVVDTVAVLGNGNAIQVSVVQNTAVLDDKPTVLSARKIVNGQNLPVTFVPTDFN